MMLALHHVFASVTHIEETQFLSDKLISRYSFYPDSLNRFQAHFSL